MADSKQRELAGTCRITAKTTKDYPGTTNKHNMQSAYNDSAYKELMVIRN